MIQRRKQNRHERGWPLETIALAHSARRELFDALHSLKAEHVEPKNVDRYERLFAQAESLLDRTEPHKLLSTAQEYLFRTRDRYDAPAATKAVARTYALQLLIAFFHDWKEM